MYVATPFKTKFDDWKIAGNVVLLKEVFIANCQHLLNTNNNGFYNHQNQIFSHALLYMCHLEFMTIDNAMLGACNNESSYNATYITMPNTSNLEFYLMSPTAAKFELNNGSLKHSIGCCHLKVTTAIMT